MVITAWIRGRQEQWVTIMTIFFSVVGWRKIQQQLSTSRIVREYHDRVQDTVQEARKRFMRPVVQRRKSRAGRAWAVWRRHVCLIGMWRDITRRRAACTVISDFVEWLKSRYGILIDCNNGAEDGPEGAKALENNYNALKSRLRQLGFYVDLSDASNSQVIRPRFPV